MPKHYIKTLLGHPAGFWIVAALSLIAIFVMSFNQIADFDTGYHLKTGEYIVDHLTVPLHDIFSYSATGARWVTHYWLSDVIFYLIYLLAGFGGLAIFAALITVLTYYIILKTALDKTGRSMVTLIILFILSSLTLELWVVRPQIFSYLLTALLVFILERWRMGGNTKLLYWIPGIFVLWANMHAGVILGIAILGVYILGLLFEQIKRPDGIKAPFVILLMSGLATLLNPNGYEILTYNLAIAPAIKELGVEEWKSLLYYTSWQAEAFVALMWASLMLVWWYSLKQRKSSGADWLSIMLISGFFIMPLMAVRHVGLFPIVAIPLVSVATLEFLTERKILIDTKPVIRLLLGIFAICLIISTTVCVWSRPIINEAVLPVGAADFIENNSLSGPVFCFPAHGGYLIFRFWPEQLVFMDSRSEVFMGAPNQDLIKVLTGQPGWQDIINEKYDVNYFVMWYREPVKNLVAEWTQRVTSELDFKLVYWDDAAIVLVKNAPQNADIIERYAYEVISPSISPFNITDPNLAQAATEIERALSISPNSVILQNYADNLTAHLGQED